MRAILCLMTAFLSSAALWMLLQAEFLSLILVIVYVGAVMTLFLFVIMMTDVREMKVKKEYNIYTSFCALISLIFTSVLVYSIKIGYYLDFYKGNFLYNTDYSNIKQIGYFTYANYLLPFEVAGFLLLTSIIVSITFANKEKKKDEKFINSSTQLDANKKDRLKIINMNGK